MFCVQRATIQIYIIYIVVVVLGVALHIDMSPTVYPSVPSSGRGPWFGVLFSSYSNLSYVNDDLYIL